jgi:hypothetical protein
MGANPRAFGGHNLIAALDAAVCGHGSAGAGGPCAAPGNFRYATSVFDQALGVIAQLRAGEFARARAPIAFLENLRNADGSFPSLIPDSHDRDVDSTAIAVMALAFLRTPLAHADVASGIAWIAGRQAHDGGFRGTSGVSVNSAGLAIQALTLRAARYRPEIRLALAFLAGQQNPDGGFNADAEGQRGSDVRASAQAIGGATGLSFGTLSWHLRSRSASRDAVAGQPGWPVLAATVVIVAAALIALWLMTRRRRARHRAAS